MFMDRFSTTVSNDFVEHDPDAIVKVAYANFIREPLRTFARNEVQRRNRLDVKETLIPIGDAVLARIRQYATGSPCVFTSVVVGNVQYPAAVSNAVSLKLAATQEVQRKDTEIEIERKERTKREVQAQGIANAMQIIRGQLSSMYIQHEAIEAQKLMEGSPNHTVVYIPSGPMACRSQARSRRRLPPGPRGHRRIRWFASRNLVSCVDAADPLRAMSYAGGLFRLNEARSCT